jgi:YggT family protein
MPDTPDKTKFGGNRSFVRAVLLYTINIVYNKDMKLLAKVIDLVTIMIGMLIALRIVLELLRASPQTPFVIWLFNLTDPLLAPFDNIFPSPIVGSMGTLNVPALFAMGIFLAAGYITSSIIQSLAKYIKPIGRPKLPT